MALQSTRLRRGFTSLSALHRTFSSPVIQTSPPIPRSFISPSSPPVLQSSLSSLLQSRSFTGSRVSLSSSGKPYKVYKEGDEITEDTVLFEGCDFNHWLITVDFPKDPRPTPEEMVATYERICAQGLNISIEEAKRKIYACSTTTYEGFQAVMTEEESDRFKDVPGVVFVLPDSYIDPQNKQYGGDLYENGKITPRPPPYQYKKAGRFNDGNRSPNQPRYDQRGGPPPNQAGNPQYNQQPRYDQRGGPPPNQAGNPQYNQQGPPPQGGRNYGPTQSYPPRQNYGPPGHGERMPMNNNNYQGQQDVRYPQDRVEGPYQGQGQQSAHYPQNPVGPYQGQGQQGNQYPPQDRREFPQGGQRDFRQDTRNFSPGNGETQGQGANTGYRQGYPAEDRSFSQMGQNNIPPEQPPYPPSMGQTGTNQGRY